MAEKDIRWFQYLADALKEKYRNPQLVYYQGHRFEPNIYKWMRQTFDTLHTRYGINYEDYLNIGERPVLERLIRNLQTDPRLSFLNKPSAVEAGQIELPDEFHQSIEQEQIAQQQAVPGGAPPQAAAPGQAPAQAPPRMAMPQMPAFPSSRQAPSEQPPAGETPETGQKPSQGGQTPQMGRRGFNFPKMPTFAKNAGSNAGIFFKKSTSRATTAASKGIGAGIGRGGNFALRVGNFGINFGLNFSNEFSRLRVGGIGRRWVAWLILLFFIVAILIGVIQTQTPAPVPGPGAIAGDISKCIFYRGGDSIPGLQYQNPAIPGLISDISSKVGVPPAIIAGIMRVESSTVFFDQPGSDYLTNDYDAHFSKDEAGNPVAYGIMQFTPNTFLGVFSRDQSELQTLFGKTEVTTNIDPQDAMAPANVFRIYSIKDSITAAAFKARDDKRTINGDGPWDQTTVYEIARRYYGALEYTGWDLSTQNYGADLWKSYSECSPTGPILADASCPVDQGHITCGSYGLPQPWSGGEAFTGICTQDSTGNAGHCNDNYIAATGLCQPKEQVIGGQTVLVWIAKSIDVVGPSTSADSPIFLPSINGQSLKWFYKGAIPADNCGGCTYGFIRSFQSEPTAQGIWTIDFTHVNPSDPFSDIDHQVQSGQVGATHYNLPVGGIHVHITLGAQILSNFAKFDPNWKFADRELKMCI